MKLFGDSCLEPHLTKQQIAAITDDIFDLIKNSLAHGERVEIRNFGNFSLRKREARKARNPKTGEVADVTRRIAGNGSKRCEYKWF